MDTNSTTVDLEDPTQAAMCLSMVEGIGPKNFQSLIEALGSPKDVLQTAPSTLRELPGIGTKLARAISLAVQTVDVESELQRCRQNAIDTLSIDRDTYPKRLREISDPPGLIYCRGELVSHDDLAIAIVGTRHATNYGKTQAEKLARSLSMCGFTIVSGLARGIDASAHRGALAASGRTIAVLGCGLLNMYPPDHKQLADEIIRHGALISENPTLQPPKSGAFPRRNRIITGLSLGVIIVEAAERSGALISARHAMEQGREVFAVPGPIDSRTSRGCHRLIRDGAKLVESVDDVLEELGPLATPTNIDAQQSVHHPAELKLNDLEQTVLQAIQSAPTEIDDIVDATGLPVHRILATVSVLEMRHLVRRTSGTSLCRR